MRVSELIEQLRKFNPRSVVMIEMANGMNTFTRPIQTIKQSGVVLTLRDYDEDNRTEYTNASKIIIAKR